LSGSKPLGPSGNFCIGLISAIAVISLPKHDLLSMEGERGFPTFHNRGTARPIGITDGTSLNPNNALRRRNVRDSLCQNTINDSRNCQTLGVPRQSRGLT